MSDNIKKHHDNIKLKLDAISPTFCIAKWKQVTMHLQQGTTHSCHHPRVHVIPLEELKKSISALHNTEFKKAQRKKMLNGLRPEECEYCWKIEDNSTHYSDRVYKSADWWASDSFEECVEFGHDGDVPPSYIEVSFSNVCNLKCAYCGPQYSSKWTEEINRHGPYPTSDRFNGTVGNTYSITDQNPYINAFWEWLPGIYDSLKELRITGGEPMMDKNLLRLLDFVISRPNKLMTLSINSNLSVPDVLLNQILDKLNIITSNKLVNKVKIFTSAEAHGPASEYIRYGMDYDKWLTNINTILSLNDSITMTVMSTYNILSVESYLLFLNDMLQIRKRFQSRSTALKLQSLLVDIPYLRYPSFLAVDQLPENMYYLVDEQIKFMTDNLEDYKSPDFKPWGGFHDHEMHKLKRIRESLQPNKLSPDFKIFVDEYDNRRGTSFSSTFPILSINIINILPAQKNGDSHC